MKTKNMVFVGLVFTSFIILTVVKCGSKSSSDTTDSSLDGTYTFQSLTCTSTGKAPEYQVSAQPAALLDFSGITSHVLVVSGTSLVDTITSSACTLTVTRSIFESSSSKITLTQEAKYSFSPANCQLSVTSASGTASIDSSLKNPSDQSLVFIDSSDTRQGQTLSLTQSGSTFKLTTMELPGIGCGEKGSLDITYVKY
jgi:hypothetical protein